MDRRAALATLWAERRALARAARAGLDLTGAVRPPRAEAERAWHVTEAEVVGYRLHESARRC